MRIIGRYFILAIFLLGINSEANYEKVKINKVPDLKLINIDISEKWPSVHSVQLSFSPTVPDYIKNEIELSVLESMIVLNKDIFSNNYNDARTVVVEVTDIDDDHFGFCSCESPEIKKCIIKLNKSMVNDPDFLVQQIFLHEVGHAFGLDHGNDKNDIMRESTNAKSARPLTYGQFSDFLHRISD